MYGRCWHLSKFSLFLLRPHEPLWSKQTWFEKGYRWKLTNDLDVVKRKYWNWFLMNDDEDGLAWYALDNLAAYESGPLDEWSLPQWRKLFITRTLATVSNKFFGHTIKSFDVKSNQSVWLLKIRHWQFVAINISHILTSRCRHPYVVKMSMIPKKYLSNQISES